RICLPRGVLSRKPVSRAASRVRMSRTRRPLGSLEIEAFSAAIFFTASARGVFSDKDRTPHRARACRRPDLDPKLSVRYQEDFSQARNRASPRGRTEPAAQAAHGRMGVRTFAT